MNYTIEIVSPIMGKGLGRVYRANNNGIETEENYVELGAIVRDDNNNVVNNVVVSVDATDPNQNKTMTGTGNIYPVRTAKGKIKTYYYPFHYQFRKKGKHKITFSVGNVQEEVQITVGENKPK